MKSTVLLIEGEQKVGELLKRSLESRGIEVTWAADGKSALSEVQRGRFDLVVLELDLPGIPGDKVLEGIRRIDPYVEVVVYTNNQDPSVMKKLINLGIDGYLDKKGEAELWQTVEEIKARLEPFTEEEREKLLESAPEGIFREQH